MHHSTQDKSETRKSGRQTWQEPMILIERSLTANAQGVGPQAGPLFGPLNPTSTTTVP